MAQPPAKPARTNKAARGTRSGRPRRVSLRLATRSAWDRLRDRLAEPWFVAALAIGLVLILSTAALAAWTREQPLLAVGRVMPTTRVIRIGFTKTNVARTEQALTEARERTPRVYRAGEAVINGIGEVLAVMGDAAATGAPLDGLDRAVRERFALDDERWRAINAMTGESPGTVSAWRRSTDQLLALLRRTPLLDNETHRRASSEGLDRRIEIVIGDVSEFIPRDQVINVADAASLQSGLGRLVDIAGFPGPAGAAVRAALISGAAPTFAFDDALTRERQAAAAKNVDAVVDNRAVNEVIFYRGDVLDQAQFDLYKQEIAEYAARATPTQRWLPRLATGSAAALATLLGIAAFALLAPEAMRRTGLVAASAALIPAAQAIAATVAVMEPRFAAVIAIAPTLLVGCVFTIVHGRNVALAAATLVALIIGLTIGLSAGWLLVLLAGAWTIVIGMAGLPSRRVASAAVVAAAAVLGITVPTAGLLEMPATGAALEQALRDGVISAIAGLVTGAFALFILPLVERVFGVITGLKLIELRDPKQPLLRELQRRAPGTYNHSLNVASIAESAADAVGADALLTYVGALYHDIGKMNKPEYFVENQSGGPNKHDSLSPAMSLLVIIGHVKDGVEIAREKRLPHKLHHFIEAHHGTTLVEYFFHRAVRNAVQAEGRPDETDDRPPDETDFRYPGPKPRTKECAILMLADAVESATRSMAEPTPSRIDTLVRDLANKRFADGQFDDCGLTFRELRAISESISRTVAAIYHGRVQYPDARRAEPKPTKAAGPA